MADAILWPDVEESVLNYLRPAIAASGLAFAGDVETVNALPKPRPNYAVTVRNDGGPPASTVFADVRLGVSVWAPTKPEAVDLAARVTAALNGAAEAGTTPFVESSATVAYEVADESGQPQMYLTATLRVRGTNL